MKRKKRRKNTEKWRRRKYDEVNHCDRSKPKMFTNALKIGNFQLNWIHWSVTKENKTFN